MQCVWRSRWIRHEGGGLAANLYSGNLLLASLHSGVNIQYIKQTIRSNHSCMMPFMKKKKVVNYFGFETIIVHTV